MRYQEADHLRCQQAIDHVFDLLQLDVPCSLHDLLAVLEGVRGRSVVLMSSDQLPGTASVVVLKHQDADVICWRAALSELERDSAICHALTHMLFYHSAVPARFCQPGQLSPSEEREADIGGAYLYTQLTLTSHLPSFGVTETTPRYIPLRHLNGTSAPPLLSDVQGMFKMIQHALGASFSFDHLVSLVEQRRKKRLVFETIPMPIGKTGDVISLRDVDLIRLRAGLNPVRSCATRLHECSHLLLGHLPIGDATTPTYAEFRNSQELQQSLSRDQGVTFSPVVEYAAETLATLLLSCVEQSGQERPGMPTFIEQFWR